MAEGQWDRKWVYDKDGGRHRGFGGTRCNHGWMATIVKPTETLYCKELVNLVKDKTI